MADAVIVAYKDGAEYEVESATIAKRAHPDAKIVRFAGTDEPYKEGAKPSTVERVTVAAAGGELVPWTEDAPVPVPAAAEKAKT